MVRTSAGIIQTKMEITGSPRTVKALKGKLYGPAPQVM
ncbi:hypothetical protein M2347_000330 [Chryseobacterium sp. H1D6B]|nr:hypothetical protein [Chryseobacterium sp. H1D6B]